MIWPEKIKVTAMQTQSNETMEVAESRITCNGNGKLGHPKVYLEIGETGSVDCPYCGKRFVLKAKTH
jgi:uncharacterized Zn-finger protein